MIEYLDKLLELMTKFAERRERIDKQVLDDVVLKTFDDLKAVHEDYIKMFGECQQQLEAGDGLMLIRDKLAIRRLEEEAERMRIWQQMAFYSAEGALGEYNSYFDAIGHYARFACWHQSRSRGAQILMTLKEFSCRSAWSKEEEPALRAELLEDLEFVLSGLRQHWRAVCRKHAEIKFHRAKK